MAPMKDYIKVEVTGDSDAVTSELYVENTIENPAWYTVEDNHVSLVSENVEKVIKLETDMLDDCMWESRIEITKDVSNQNNVELPLECQDVADNNIYLNHGNTSDKIFHCNICGKSFVLNYLLKNHLAEHKRQVNRNTNKCKYCGKRFKLKFDLHRHIQKHHNPMHKSKYRSKFTEHKNIHEKNQTNIDTIPNIKLCKLNGVWKSKTNEFKCNICFQKCYSEKNLVEHMETHDDSQTQCNYCLDYVSVSELNNHMENIHNKHLFKCQKCNQQFKKQQHLNCHLIHCLRSSYTKSNKVCGKYKANEKTCSACGITFNNSLSLTNHTTIGCKHYTCKYCGQFFSKRHFWLKHMDVHKKVEQCAILKANTNETSTIRENNQTEIINDSFNTNGGQLLSRDVTGRNSLDHTSLVNSNSTAVVSTAPHTYIPNNDIISNPESTETLSNSLERNSSNLIHSVPSESTFSTYPPMSSPERELHFQEMTQIVDSEYFPSPVPMYMVQEKIINLKQEKFFHNTVRDHFQRQLNIRQSQINRQQSALSINPHNSVANNESPFIDFGPLREILKKRKIEHQNKIANRIASIVAAASHDAMANNNSPVINIKQERNLSSTLRRKNSTDQTNLANRNESIVAAASHDTMANNNSSVINIKHERNLSSTLRRTNSTDETNLANRNESIVSAASHNAISNNNSPVLLSIKQEKNLCTNARERNSSDQADSVNSNESIVSAASHNAISNNNSPVLLSIKQEKNLCTNARERNSSDQADSVNSNESILTNKPQDLMAKQNPINIADNNIASTVRDTLYFCIRKLPNIKNGFCSNNYDQTSQNNVIFICRICKNSPSADIHSFALHMSYHSECNMHECIVCDKTFSSVVLWTDHMTYHQQQIDSNVSTVQFNPQETESNTLEDPINSENMEPQIYTNLRNKKLKISLMNGSHSDTTKLNSAKKIKYQYDCSTCKKVFPSKSALQVHQTLHNTPLSFSCRYCSKIFSGKGPCTNHEKSHIIPDRQLLKINENIKLEPILIQNSISIEDNNTDFETMSIKHIKRNKSSSTKKTNFCNLCNRKFTKRCYFTNHMMIKHNLNPNTPKQLPSIDCNKPIIQSENTELTNEYKTKLSVPVNNKNNNLNNHVNKSNEKKSTVCMSCNKHFAHLGALTNHMRVHYYKPYKCQYCFMQFSKKRPYIMHEKKHVLKNVVKSANNQNKNSIGVEVNDEPQIEHCNDFEFVHSQVDNNSSGTNFTDIEHLWFSCDVCEEKFSTPLELNIHRNSHSGIVPFVCKICNRSFQLKFRWNWHLKGHYKRHNSNSQSMQQTNNLKSNISKQKVESIHHIDKMKCRYCKKEYNSISQWKKHMTMSKECRRHCKSNLPEFTSNKTTKNSSKSGRYRCNICEKTFSTTSNRNVHKKNVHNVLDTTDLNTCDDTVLQEDKPMDIIQQKLAIKKRNRSNHTNGTKCGLCGKIYSSTSNLSRHISITHSQTFEPITCYVCGSTFKHKLSYQEHLKTKHNVETNPTNKRISRQVMEVNKKNNMKYFCKICKMKFADNITLQEHSKIHTLNVYMCKDCGQQFETNVTLGNHILENHKANISTSSINKHVENHESENTSLESIDYKCVQCKICLKVLKTPKYLRLHMRLHTGVKPFKCNKCNQTFRFNSNFRVHQRKDSCCIP